MPPKPPGADKAVRELADLIRRKIFKKRGSGKQGEARKQSRLDMLWNKWTKDEAGKGKAKQTPKQTPKPTPKQTPKQPQKLLPASKEAQSKQSAAVRARIKRANEAEKNLPKSNPRAVGKFRGSKKMEVPEGVKKAGAKVKKVAKKAASKIPKTTTKQKVKAGAAGAGLYYLSEKYKQVKKKQKKSKK